MVHAIENQRNGMQVHLSNDINSAMGCMTIFNGIYLSQKLGRPVTKDEILADSMEQLVNPSPKAEPEEEAPIKGTRSRLCTKMHHNFAPPLATKPSVPAAPQTFVRSPVLTCKHRSAQTQTPAAAHERTLLSSSTGALAATAV